MFFMVFSVLHHYPIRTGDYKHMYTIIATDNQLERILEKNMNISRFLDVLSDYLSTF